VTKIKLTERKFTPNELKQLNSKTYLSWKCTRQTIIIGNDTDFALFTVSECLGCPHHSIGITPIVKRGDNALKVVVSFMDKGEAKRFSAIGATTVMFTTDGTIADAVGLGSGLAKAQYKLLYQLPCGAVRVGRVPKKQKATV